MNHLSAQRWYGEPWVWFNLVLLGAAIVSASVMSVIAIRHTPAEIGSHWYQDGVLAKRERQQEVLVQKLHLMGDLSISPTGKIHLNLRHDDIEVSQHDLDMLDAKQLQLYIEHPTNPEMDQVITLKKMAPMEYSGQLNAALNGKRRLLISPPGDLWYIATSSYFPVSQLTFSPELG